MDPRPYHPSTTFTHTNILRYLLFKNPSAIIVHRVNECDQRKNTFHINGLLKRANYCADHTVFVGSWLKSLDTWNHLGYNFSTIENGADNRIFNSSGLHLGMVLVR